MTGYEATVIVWLLLAATPLAVLLWTCRTRRPDRAYLPTLGRVAASVQAVTR